jgi:hypothetical protein
MPLREGDLREMTLDPGDRTMSVRKWIGAVRTDDLHVRVDVHGGVAA